MKKRKIAANACTEKQRRRMYQGLLILEGMCKANIPDASMTIDDVVYGQSGGVLHERQSLVDTKDTRVISTVSRLNPEWLP